MIYNVDDVTALVMDEELFEDDIGDLDLNCWSRPQTTPRYTHKCC